MVAGAQGGGYALGIWMPTYLRTVRHLSATGAGGFLLVQILARAVRLSARDLSVRCHRPQMDLSVARRSGP